MKILFNLKNTDGWIRAAQYLNHEAFKLNTSKVFDSFGLSKPNLLITNFLNDEIKKASFKFKCPCVFLEDYLPAADFPPNFSGGIYKDEYKCDLLIIGTYKPEYKKYLVELNNGKVNYKIFGYGNWNVPEFLGNIHNNDVVNAYKSAKYSVDFDGDEDRVLAISISGGNPLSAGKWEIGINDLDTCPHFSNQTELVSMINKEPSFKSNNTPLIMDRLKELLGKIQ